MQVSAPAGCFLLQDTRKTPVASVGNAKALPQRITGILGSIISL
jgi:hypothetical protein